MNKIENQIREQFKYLDYAPILFVSAKHKQRVHTIVPVIEEVHD